MDWSRAACLGTDPAMWFPDSTWGTVGQGGDERRLLLRRCREICADCPIRDECLRSALRNSESGVWAGTTPKQRRALREGRSRVSSLASPA